MIIAYILQSLVKEIKLHDAALEFLSFHQTFLRVF